jgi:multisubunit Na+/H+ antiporter MnhE subunit
MIGLNNPDWSQIVALTENLIVGLFLSLVVAWYYERFGQSLSNRSKLARLLPVLTLTTNLVISIIKSSVALSLGLVGALLVVRFRTAVKEPEELIFLFIAIAIGLGAGADELWLTATGILVILGYMTVFTSTFQ